MAVKDGLPATDFSRMNREWVKAVAEGGSGGGGLPEITEADEGKVLTVESGEAAWATAGGGGGGVFLLTPTESETRLTLDKTCTEIETAFASGIPCVYFIEFDGRIERWELFLVTHSEEAEDPPYAYTFNSFDGHVINHMIFTAESTSDYPYFVYE